MSLLLIHSEKLMEAYQGLHMGRQRETNALSGSPGHKGLKKVHFIKNMRQCDTKNSRIVLICAKRTLCVAFSILPYGESLRIR
uniref:CDK5 and ABL1 enzyme substrate 2 n=1 Tax=Sphaerodactylus townsendi TaxID=933632 RepID=A0ACB8F6N1_9SAUR